MGQRHQRASISDFEKKLAAAAVPPPPPQPQGSKSKINHDDDDDDDSDDYDYDDDNEQNPPLHSLRKRRRRRRPPAPLFASDSSEILAASEFTFTSHIPHECMKSTWQLLFSSSKHGSSFTTFYTNVMHRGPVVVLIKDMDGFVFGGFCSPTLTSDTEFHGDNGSFLFSVRPRSAVYVASNLNANFVFLNVEQKRTRPTCFAMGGQLDRFALQLYDGMARGASRDACATFVSPVLSHQAEFEVMAVEAWGFAGMAKKYAPPPKPPKQHNHVSEEERRTGRFLLQTAGIIGDYGGGGG